MTGPSSGVVQPIDGRLERLGDYRLLAELARGGMGRVYLARRAGEAGFERLFAVKVMHHHMSDDEDAVLMLLDEGQIASQLHHPNVVSVVDVGTYEGGYYLVMDYVDGCSFHDLLRANKTSRPVAPIVAVALDALNGLHAVHELRDADGQLRNVVHRDVSPHNLLLGLDGACRVTDFGVAKASARFTSTLAGTQKGKIAYMAPEQILAVGDVDRRADVWSMGLTIYQALTTHHPLRGATDAATIQNTLECVVPPPSTVGLKSPPELDAVVMKALARDPAARYPTARAFGEALRRAALTHGHLGSSSEVAEWLGSSLGDALAERRAYLQSIKRGSASTSLPVLRRVSATPSAALTVDLAPPSASVASRAEAPPVAELVAEPARATAEPRRSQLVFWAAGAALVLIAVVLATLLALASGSEEPETFAVELRVNPPRAEVALDGRVLGRGHVVLELPRDGRVHTLEASAEGYETERLIFVDRPPPPDVVLVRNHGETTRVELVAPAAAPVSMESDEAPRDDGEAREPRPPVARPNVRATRMGSASEAPPPPAEPRASEPPRMNVPAVTANGAPILD